MLELAVIVTSACANARPARLEPVKVMAVPARIFPTNVVPENVAVVASCQYTLHALPPPAMTTEPPPLGVIEPPLKIQTEPPSPFGACLLYTSPSPRD